ncbi:MAG: GNAT family N-acetyltransferase [bacterium]|nr:GNAT family N-acetyltransferase [bacterium]
MIVNENVFSVFPEIHTDNLTLRNILHGDAKDIYSVYSDPEAMKYFGKHPMESISGAAEMVDTVAKAFSDHEGLRWGICFRNSDELIGTAGIWRIDKRHCRGEIGYELKREYWEKGIMTEAFKAIVDFGFNDLNLHTIEANTDPLNIASMKLLEKSGFVKEGYLKESYFFDGKFYDNVIYSIVRK